ncbi:pentapeptide repeat-containing protein [Streptomyces sp. NBC_01602]|uniref:pentapeptide repeat-containing protein n=1 Tax=Streptomyces sp. NBC_01602 TaxID=2975893 RepID=UPI00386F0564
MWSGRGSRFKDQISFIDAKFRSPARFNAASFEHVSVKFDRVLFEGQVDFSDTHFEHSPAFEGMACASIDLLTWPNGRELIDGMLVPIPDVP